MREKANKIERDEMTREEIKGTGSPFDWRVVVLTERKRREVIKWELR